MVAATLLWGATFVVIRDGLEAITPTALVAARFLAAALLWVVFLGIRAAAGASWDRRAAGAALRAGILGAPFAAAGYWLQATGLRETSAGSSAFLTSTGSLFAALFAWLLLRQRPGGVLALGLVIALVGSALLGIRDQFRLGTGEAWTLLGALLYSVQIVIVARWSPVADPYLLTAFQSAGMAILLLPWMGEVPRQMASLEVGKAAGLVYLVVAGSILAPLLQVLAQRALQPGRIGLLFALEPVFALIFALTWGQERFVPRWWIGAGLILAAVVMVESRAASQESASSRPATGGAEEAR
jgi:drug/metabolite transporter (DMT)-like permease